MTTCLRLLSKRYYAKSRDLKKIQNSAVRETDKYVLFYHGCFSQFWEANMIIDEKKYFCCEQYMMAQKAKLFNDNQIYDAILNANTPTKCKSLGRKVHGFDEKVWDKHKRDVVYQGNYAKFTQNESLYHELLSYGYDKIFVEAAPNDSIWGICWVML